MAIIDEYTIVQSQYPECLVFCQIGEFYEVLGEDAVLVSHLLSITLTKKGKIPMCGIPKFALESYVVRLLNLLRKVLIYGQIESGEGEQRSIHRAVTRVFTPGTAIEAAYLENKNENYLAAVMAVGKKQFAVAWADLSVGHFAYAVTDDIESHLLAIMPSELLLPRSLSENISTFQKLGVCLTFLDEASYFSCVENEHLLQQYFQGALWSLSKEEKIVCGMIVRYTEVVYRTSSQEKHNQFQFEAPSRVSEELYLSIDRYSRKNLELFATGSEGSVKGSLFHVLNLAVTKAGARMLRRFLSAPLRKADKIRARLNMVDFLYQRSPLVEDMRRVLTKLPDFERACIKVNSGRYSATDVLSIKLGLRAVSVIMRLIDTSLNAEEKQQIRSITRELGDHQSLLDLLESALLEYVDPENKTVIKKEYDPVLFEMYSVLMQKESILESFTKKYKKLFSVVLLKIAFNNTLGYFIEVPSKYAASLEDTEGFRCVQRLASSVRYVSDELKEFEKKILLATESVHEIEREVLKQLVAEICLCMETLLLCARALGKLDAILSLVVVAQRGRFVKPTVTDGDDFEIRGGRHPVLASMLGQECIANDIACTEQEKIWLITAPNMSGKSTFLRQNALIAILAQMGSFVPAESACIGVFDQIFCRVGASDNLLAGYSTFMLEMLETARIAQHATRRSLVIIDELGRGTSTYDGIAIALSVIEYLRQSVQCRAIVATHYYELVPLTKKLGSMGYYTMKVHETNGDLVFLYKLRKGYSKQSYGVAVAKMAGLPSAITERANAILKEMITNEWKVLQDV